MSDFRADLHIHSRFSRATSSKLTVGHLAAWARLKGLDVVATGDITHPQWREELREQLRLDEASGLYLPKTAPDLATEAPSLQGQGPDSLPGGEDRPYFMLQGEISSIYKHDGKTRKIHNLVFFPDFETADRFCTRLGALGNLNSDGRPIVGLSAHNVLELVLESGPGAFLVPAHIWTPWFSLFGSKSGYDSLEQCFGDLSSEVFALETGLSSDPEMNWLLSSLDRYALISNSDAHSGDKLGREANLFSGQVGYTAIVDALRGKADERCRFDGTLEFFPEEGKYHMDGHRACNVMLDPHETRASGGLCPVCGKPVTVGVLHRVLELADRETARQPEGAPGFVSLIPLPELLSEIVGTGPATRKVQDWLARALRRFGPELHILQNVPEAELSLFFEPLGEAVGRMRRGEVSRQGGYDGEFGTVKVFSERERQSMRQSGHPARTGLLPGVEEAPAGVREKKVTRRSKLKKEEAPLPPAEAPAASPLYAPEPAPETVPEEAKPGLNAEQEAAVRAPGPLLVLAGPGTGKTRTLVARVEALIRQGVSARRILAVTFTRRAAGEMRERLEPVLRGLSEPPRIDTLHALAFDAWEQETGKAPILLSEENAFRLFFDANSPTGISMADLRRAWKDIGLRRELRTPLDDEAAQLHRRYTDTKAAWNQVDYTDLLEFWLDSLEAAPLNLPWSAILVDEVQDLSPLQFALIRALTPNGGQGLFCIGDPDQAIYGFRGASENVLGALQAAWPNLSTVSLTVNYRSGGAILHSAAGLMRGHSVTGATRPGSERASEVRLFEAPDAEREAAWVAQQAQRLLGATSHSLLDAAGEGGLPSGPCSPGDIAVLVRFKALMPLLQRVLSTAGIPVSVPVAEAYWEDPRVALLLAGVGQMLGISPPDGMEPLECPPKILALGPLGVSAYLRERAPFDDLFWQSGAFRALVRAYDQVGSWPGLLNRINEQNELELVRQKSETVQIMTLHASKGLEFKAVFLPCLEEGVLPFIGTAMLTGKLSSTDERPEEDAERRLLYVGMTRAAEVLFLSHAQRRRLYGSEVSLKSSRFLAAVPLEHAKRSRLIERHKVQVRQLDLF